MGAGIFTNPPQPILQGTEHTRVDRGNGMLTPRAEKFHHDMWSWVSSGYVIIPCDTSGSKNKIDLTPRIRPDRAATGYTHLMMFSFVALYGNDSTVLIRVGSLDYLPAYHSTVLQPFTGPGTEIVAGCVYTGIYLDAVVALGVPARMVLCI